MIIIIYLFLITLYVRPQDWVPLIQGLPTHWILLPLGLLVGFARNPATGTALSVPQLKVLLLYIVWIFISTAHGADVSFGIYAFTLFFKRALVFLFVLLGLTTGLELQRVLRFMMWLSMFLVFQALLQYTTGESWGGMTRFPGYEEIRVRWYGDWDGPNVLGLLFTLSAAMSLDRIFGEGKTLMARALGASYFMASFAGVFFTNSRGAFLGVLVGLFYFLRSRLRWWQAGLIGAAVLAALVAVGPSRTTEISSSESSAGERVWLWEQGLTLLRENPIFGVGRGQFARRVDLGLIAHNNYVQNFAETGMVGFLCFIGLLWFSYKPAAIVQDPKNGYSPELQSAARQISTMIVTYMATTFFVVMENDLLFLLFGLAAALMALAAREQPTRPILAIKMTDLVFIGAAAAAIILMVWLAAVKEVV